MIMFIFPPSQLKKSTKIETKNKPKEEWRQNEMTLFWAASAYCLINRRQSLALAHVWSSVTVAIVD